MIQGQMKINPIEYDGKWPRSNDLSEKWLLVMFNKSA